MSNACPVDSCDYESESEYGVKIHANKSHDVCLRGEQFTCTHCGTVDRRKKYQLDKHDENFCSPECYHEYVSENNEGRMITCHVCGEKEYKQPSHLEYSSSGKYFCSRQCKGQHYSGENNPMWKDKDYSDFTKTPAGRAWRQAVIERDAGICQDCGSEPQTPHTHHIKPKSEFPELKTDVDNGVTLCEDCHVNRHPEKEELIQSTSDYEIKEEAES